MPTNPWLVHYYTALSTGIPRAAPKYLLVSCHIHAVHSCLAADEVCTFLLSRFELDQLSQSVLGFQGTAAQTCPRACDPWHSCAPRRTTHQAPHNQYSSFLETCHFWKALLPLVHQYLQSPLHRLCAQGRANPDPRLCNLIPTPKLVCRAAADASNRDKMDTRTNNGSI